MLVLNGTENRALFCEFPDYLGWKSEEKIVDILQNWKGEKKIFLIVWHNSSFNKKFFKIPNHCYEIKIFEIVFWFFFVKFGSDFLANQSIAVLKRDTFRKVVANSADKKPSNLQTKVVLRKENASSTDLLRPKGIISSRKTNRDKLRKNGQNEGTSFLFIFSSSFF